MVALTSTVRAMHSASCALIARRFTALPAIALLLVLAFAGSADADVVLEPADQYVFGDVPLGTTVVQEVAVVNEGTAAVLVGSSSVAGDASISLAYDDCAGVTLDANEFCVLDVSFLPTVVGPAQAQLTVPTD